MRNRLFIFWEALCERQVISFLLLARCFGFWWFIMCHFVDLFEFILLRFHRGSGCIDHVFFQICEVFGHNLFRYPSCPFLSSPSGTPIMHMLVHLIVSHRPLRWSSFSLELFSLYSSDSMISTDMCSHLLIPLLCQICS